MSDCGARITAKHSDKSNGANSNSNHAPERLGFNIECRPGYKEELLGASSDYIDSLIRGINRDGSPLESAKRELSTARLNIRRQKEARIIKALPDALPARVGSLNSNGPDGELGLLSLMVERREQVAAVFEKLRGVPLVLDRVLSDPVMEHNSMEHNSIEISSRMQVGLVRRFAESVPISIHRIAPFYWRHHVHSESSWTSSVNWFTELTNKQGSFLVKIEVVVLDDPARIVLRTLSDAEADEEMDNSDRYDTDEENTAHLGLRFTDAPNGQLQIQVEMPRRDHGMYNMYWFQEKYSPADVFGYVENQQGICQLH